MMLHKVEFSQNEENDSKVADRVRKDYLNSSQISLTRIAKKLHLAHTEAQAQKVVIAVGTLSFLAAIFIILYFILGVGVKKEIKYINIANPQPVQTIKK